MGVNCSDGKCELCTLGFQSTWVRGQAAQQGCPWPQPISTTVESPSLALLQVLVCSGKSHMHWSVVFCLGGFGYFSSVISDFSHVHGYLDSQRQIRLKNVNSRKMMISDLQVWPINETSQGGGYGGAVRRDVGSPHTRALLGGAWLAERVRWGCGSCPLSHPGHQLRRPEFLTHTSFHSSPGFRNMQRSTLPAFPESHSSLPPLSRPRRHVSCWSVFCGGRV